MYSEWANKIDHFSSQIMHGKEVNGTKKYKDNFTKTTYSLNYHHEAEIFLQR
jgi:hypothetical protein